jgi:hypothetical protein
MAQQHELRTLSPAHEHLLPTLFRVLLSNVAALPLLSSQQASARMLSSRYAKRLALQSI